MGATADGLLLLSIPSGSCYCGPMICALAPFPTCSHRIPAALSLVFFHDGKPASDQTSIPETAFLPVEHLTVCELCHTTAAANRVEFGFSRT